MVKVIIHYLILILMAGELCQAQLLPGLQKFPSEGSINALVIFVQFRNDNFEHCVQVDGYDDEGIPMLTPVPYEPNCSTRPNRRDGWEIGAFQSWTDNVETEWPRNSVVYDENRRALPMWAKGTGMIDKPNSTSLTEGSLTSFYHLLSNGTFNFRGFVYPYVYVPNHDQDYYEKNLDGFENNAVSVSHEVISYVRDNPFDIPLNKEELWDKYTNGDGQNFTPDGKFDLIILVFRFNGFKKIIGGSGISSFGSTRNEDSFQHAPLSLGKLKVIGGYPRGSGIINSALTKKEALKMITHELGHRHFGAHVESPFDVMGQGPYNFFGARNRLAMGWAVADTVDLDVVQKEEGNVRYFLGDLFSHRLLIIKRGERSCGDVLVEVRNQNTFWDAPSNGKNGDGDSGDTALPSEGLYLHKIPGKGCETLNEFKSLENTGLQRHRKDIFREGNKPPLSHIAFGEGDAFTPFSVFKFNTLRNDKLDKSLAITDIVKEENGYSFTIWSDFLENTNAERKIIPNNYGLHSQTMGQFLSNTWKLNGQFLFKEGLEIPLGTKLVLSDTAKIFVEKGKMVQINCLGGEKINFESPSPLWSWLLIKKNLECLQAQSK